MTRLTRLLLTVAAVAVTVSSCNATVATTVDVNDDATAELVVSLRFDGELADQLDTDPALVSSLETALTARIGDFTSSRDGDSYIWQATLGTVNPVAGGDIVAGGEAAAQLASIADIVGVAAVAVEQRDDTALVKVATVDPVGLRDAFETVTATAPDQSALLATFTANTAIVVQVQFPGDVLDAGEFTADGNRALLAVPLAEQTEPAAYSLLGSLESDGGIPWTFLLVAVAGVGLVAAGIWRRP